MKKIVVLLISIALVIFGMSVFVPATAASCPFGGSPNWLGECDTTTENGEEYFGPPMTEEEAAEYTKNNSKPKTSTSDESLSGETNSTEDNVSNDSASNSSSNVSNEGVSSNNSNNSVPEIITENPDVGHGYAAVDSNGNVLSVIVCAYNVCGKDNNWLNVAIGQGVFPQGTRLILQTLRNEETNNVAGYMHAKYNQEINSFVIVENNGAIFKIPLAYPGLEEMICIENCENLTIEETEQNNSSTEETSNNSFEETMVPMIFSTKLKSNTLATVVATNKNKKKVWKTKVNKKGIIKINVAKKYKKWKFKVKVDTSRKFIRRN